MFQLIEREFKLAALPLFLIIIACAIILRSFYVILDRPQPSYSSEHEVTQTDAAPRTQPPQQRRVQSQRQPIRHVTRSAPRGVPKYNYRAWPQAQPQSQPRPSSKISRAPASIGRGPASIGPSSVTGPSSGLRFQPQPQPLIQKKNTSFLAKVIGKDAVRDLKEIISSEERTEYFLQRELNVTESDLQLIRDEKMRLYTKLRELDQQNDPTKTQQERTTLIQQHKAWMESVIGAEGYQRLQQIRGL